jgi:hypothetical protein
LLSDFYFPYQTLTVVVDQDDKIIVPPIWVLAHFLAQSPDVFTVIQTDEPPQELGYTPHLTTNDPRVVHEKTPVQHRSIVKKSNIGVKSRNYLPFPIVACDWPFCLFCFEFDRQG